MRKPVLRGKDVLVIGTKRSGIAAIRLLVGEGARVRAMDAHPPIDEERVLLDQLGVPVVLQADENVGEPAAIVISPAVPSDLPMLQSARARGIPVLGEVELASRYLKGPVIGITGSNGKTTTTALTGHLLKECGIECQVGGNIGTAVTTLINTSSEHRWNVLELSSFQLETISQFRARIGACLNLTPDHLDRHHTMENYVNAKARLFETQRPGDHAVLNYDDPGCRGLAARTPADVFWFSATQPVSRGVSLQGQEVCWEGTPFMERSAIRLRGMHNVENAMAAASMAHLAGASLARIGPAITSFPGVEHRIEFVRNFRGVEYYNDSKATNVDATLKAIEAFPGPLWIILGGKDKGSPYTPLREPLREKAKTALLIGAAAPLIERDLAGSVPLVNCGTLAEAVGVTAENAREGDTVLLAPACASFDQFENFEHRGRLFKHLVLELV
ncbi:MAG TPA: UDP-N-acetylmuramoyl-L-alanine--D-glutamate ligase [Bryobacteraceae bacterium]|jgi:UDP-N-acetylmuramoylalanine--D-glutamate ligase|nr:UDP-N-acetylmuramoyl-L-alanine--D-glutamate ligase [Bryobacteraceae bacterium]